MSPLLVLEDVGKTYGEGEAATVALDQAAFSINKGEFVSIMGPSGSGKSTLLHILGLLTRPTRGRYLLGGRDTATLSDDELAHLRNEYIGFVFQSFFLLPHATVLENVILPLQYSRVPVREYRERALHALERVNMLHRLHHTPTQLSGGEKQRVVIARALITRPPLIMADEPTGNLDSRMGHAVMETIDGLHKEGHTIVVITHETPTAEYSEHIIRLEDGRITSDVPVSRRHTHYQK